MYFVKFMQNKKGFEQETNYQNKFLLNEYRRSIKPFKSLWSLFLYVFASITFNFKFHSE